MNNSMKFLVKEKNVNERLDVFLSKKINFLTRSHIKKIIENSHVKINGKLVYLPSKRVKTNDTILIVIALAQSKNCCLIKLS